MQTMKSVLFILLSCFVFSLSAKANEQEKTNCHDFENSSFRIFFSKSLEEQKRFFLNGARKVSVTKNASIRSVLENDGYSYREMDKWIYYVQVNNDLKTNTTENREFILLPYCQNIFTKNIVKKEEPEEKPEPKFTKLSIQSSFGEINLKANNELDSEMTLSFYKVGLSAKKKIDDTYSTLLKIASTKFHSLSFKSSAVTRTAEVANIYFDYGAGISRKIKGYNVSLIYQNQNYFLVSKNSDVKISPNRIEKISLSSAYNWKYNLSFPATFSLFAPITTEVTGIDFSPGILYRYKKLSMGVFHYWSKLESPHSSEEISLGQVLSLSYQL